MDKITKIAIFPTLISSYREDFYKRLVSNTNYDVTLFCQDSIPWDKQKVINSLFTQNLYKLNFKYFKKGNIIWQYLPYKFIKNHYDIYMIVGNPRVITDVVLSIYLRLLGKKVIIWAMVHSHRSIRINLYLRLLWYSLFKYIFVYNENEEKYLKKIFKNKLIISMNNGLDFNKIYRISQKWTPNKIFSWKIENNLFEKEIFISSSRLKKKNNFGIVIECLNYLVHKKNYSNIVWVIIGDGEEMTSLQNKVKDLNLSTNIIFLGSIYDDEILAPYFLSSKFFIHPEAIGLSILHAFSYGLPIVVCDDFSHHGPEIVAFKNKFNGLSFSKGCTESLQIVIELLINEKCLCDYLSRNALLTASDKFNTRIMEERFNDLISCI